MRRTATPNSQKGHYEQQGLHFGLSFDFIIRAGGAKIGDGGCCEHMEGNV